MAHAGIRAPVTSASLRPHGKQRKIGQKAQSRYPHASPDGGQIGAESSRGAECRFGRWKEGGFTNFRGAESAEVDRPDRGRRRRTTVWSQYRSQKNRAGGGRRRRKAFRSVRDPAVWGSAQTCACLPPIRLSCGRGPPLPAQISTTRASQASRYP